METLKLRKADANEIELMAKARVEYCLREASLDDKSEYNKFLSDVTEWTARNVKNENYIGYFGYLDGKIVCFAGVLLSELPPILINRNRKQGYILSFFTYPGYRRQGIGNKLMQYLMEDAKKMGIQKLALIATDEGIPLYRKNGFNEPKMLYMEKKLN